MYCAIGSPWSAITPGAKYCGALMPPAAVSMGKPGIEMGAPGRPGLASSNCSRTNTVCDGSGLARLNSAHIGGDQHLLSCGRHFFHVKPQARRVLDQGKPSRNGRKSSGLDVDIEGAQ